MAGKDRNRRKVKNPNGRKIDLKVHNTING